MPALKRNGPISPVDTDQVGPTPIADTVGFVEFMAELGASFPEKSYRWTKAKERSCDWLIDRIPAGARGVDIGGTEYLCEKLSKKGCDITLYDFSPPREFPKSVQDDMFNVLRHFEPKSLDFIVTRHTLEHSFAPLFQLWAYNRLLADDGLLLVTVPCFHRRWVWMATHFSAVPPENWHMLFHRAGFKVCEFTTGVWKRNAPEFVEYRFVLQIASRRMQLTGRPQRLAGIDDATPEQLPLPRPLRVTAAPDSAPNALPTIRARARSVKKRVLNRVRGWLG
jgi:SAM-dependent methyltransferase